MRKVHELLRLHFDLNLPQRQIARSIKVSQSTVNEYLSRFQQSGLGWPVPQGYDDRRLQEELFGAGRPTPPRPLPDFAHIRATPARVRKPRDKAKVEVGVQIAQRWIVAALRHRKFFSVGELNAAIRELLEKLNQRPFKKRDGCRRSLFDEIDWPALRPLPAERYDLSVWSKAIVNIDYHVQVDGSFYSVPYTLARKAVEVRTTPATVEIFTRAPAWLRTCGRGSRIRPSRSPNTGPRRTRRIWNGRSRLVDWARKTGRFAAQLFQHILDRYPHPEMGYRSCLGLLRLGEKYGPKRLEAACERALVTGAASDKSVKSILAHSLDLQPVPPDSDPPRSGGHDNIRGAGYYQ